MKTLAYTEIENAVPEDIGKIALMYLTGPTLAIEPTLYECLKTAEKCGVDLSDFGKIDDHTDLYYLSGGHLVAVEVGRIVIDYDADIKDQITQHMIDRAGVEASFTNYAPALGGIAASMALPVITTDNDEYELVIKFEADGHELDDETMYMVGNIIDADLQ